MFYICSVQYGIHYMYMAMKHMKCGEGDGETNF